MWKSFFKRAAIGFLIGVVAGNVIAFLVTGGMIPWVSHVLTERFGAAGALLLQSVFLGLYGMATFGGTLLYEIESWPLARCTFVHWIIVVGLYALIALFLDWMKGPAELLIAVGAQTVGFFIIWLIMYLRYKAEVRELNELMEKRKEKDRKED